MSSHSRLVTLLCTCPLIIGAGWAPAAGAQLRSRPSQRPLAVGHAGDRHGPRAAKATRVSVAVSLRERHRAQLSAFIRALDTPGSREFGHPLTPSQFRARFSPTAAQANRVVRFLRRLGFRQVELTGNRLFVTARVSIADARRVFKVRLARLSQGGRTVYATLSAPSVPGEISASVRAVLGPGDLADFMRPVHAVRFTSTAAPNCSQPAPSIPRPFGACYYTPSAFRTAYDAGSLTGAGVPIAIMAEGNLSQTIRDLRTAEANFGEPAVPYTIERVGRGGGGDQSGTAEWDLDTQAATAMAPDISRLYLYDVRRLTDANVALEINRWVSQDLTRAASASFGECESLPHADGIMAAGDEIMGEAAAQGQTLFVAAGDGGGQRCKAATPAGRIVMLHQLNYPCTAEYVVCVGGTSLYTNADGSYQQEIAWHASGGGTSTFEHRPPWQRCAGESARNSVHGEPDIAMDAGLNTGAEVYFIGHPGELGGTSLAAPLALGAWADVESAAPTMLGPATQLLYRLYPATPCAGRAPAPLTAPLGSASADPSYPFHDIYLGSDAAYRATPGWDYATGLGSFDVAKVSAALNALATSS